MTKAYLSRKKVQFGQQIEDQRQYSRHFSIFQQQPGAVHQGCHCILLVDLQSCSPNWPVEKLCYTLSVTIQMPALSCCHYSLG